MFQIHDRAQHNRITIELVEETVSLMAHTWTGLFQEMIRQNARPFLEAMLTTCCLDESCDIYH